jgi:hypothetical protein
MEQAKTENANFNVDDALYKVIGMDLPTALTLASLVKAGAPFLIKLCKAHPTLLTFAAISAALYARKQLMIKE